jgi:hypothetical protein
MKRIVRASLLIFVILVSASAAQAVTITFENFAPAGGLVNINPALPYTEAGFTISVLNGQSAVFDSAAAVDMPGNLTDFFGFAEINTPTLTFAGGTFDLASVLIGRSTVATTPVTMVITGTLTGGGTLTATFTGLTTATVANLNWVGLQNVSFTASDDAALDDIVVTTVPEVDSLTLLALGLLTIGIARAQRVAWLQS